MYENPADNPKLMKAVNDYLTSRGLVLPHNVRYGYMIDAAYVEVDDKTVLVIGLPPVSNFPVRETEYTNRYLRPAK